MMKSFGVQNFKAVKEFQKLELKPITVFMGENSSGKSSFLQAISLLSFNKIYGNGIERISYNNPFFDLIDGASFKKKGEVLVFEFEIEDEVRNEKNDNHIYHIKLEYKDDPKDAQFGVLENIKISSSHGLKTVLARVNIGHNKDLAFSLKLEEIGRDLAEYSYLKTPIGSEMILYTNLKILTGVTYKSDLSTTDNNDSVDFFEANINKIVELTAEVLSPINKLIESFDTVLHVGAGHFEEKARLNYAADYVGYFSENFKTVATRLKSKIFLNKSISKVFGYRIHKIDVNSDEILMRDENAENSSIDINLLGSSIKSALPILVQISAIQSSENPRVVIIEEPEAHLHPMAQAKLAEHIFCNKGKSNQLIVETHSDHIANKLRHLVFTKKLKSKDVVIYYKEKCKKDFFKIEIDNNGRFTNKGKVINFPRGFFDATLEEVMEINLGGNS